MRRDYQEPGRAVRGIAARATPTTNLKLLTKELPAAVGPAVAGSVGFDPRSEHLIQQGVETLELATRMKMRQSLTHLLALFHHLPLSEAVFVVSRNWKMSWYFVLRSFDCWDACLYRIAASLALLCPHPWRHQDPLEGVSSDAFRSVAAVYEMDDCSRHKCLHTLRCCRGWADVTSLGNLSPHDGHDGHHGHFRGLRAYCDWDPLLRFKMSYFVLEETELLIKCTSCRILLCLRPGVVACKRIWKTLKGNIISALYTFNECPCTTEYK